mgnify:CR=1 FL=1
MFARQLAPRTVSILIAAAALAIAACGGGSTGPTKPVVSVNIIATPTNPRVGQAALVSATPVDSGGIQIQGVPCTYASDTPAVASVAQSGPNANVTGVSVGTATITATCGGKSNSVLITVRPRLVTLTLTALGTGSGALFANPPGLSYDSGTVVTMTATPVATSAFSGWGGACSGTAGCVVTMTANTTVTATFTDGITFASSAAFGGAMSSVTDPAPPGCTYSVSANFTSLTLLVTASAANGTASTDVTVSGGGSCTGLPFTVAATGTLTVNGSAITGTLTHFSNTYQSNDQTLTISATRSGTTITGTLSISEVLRNGAGTAFTSTGGPFAFSMAQQP